MNIVVYILLVLLALKCVYNLTVPYSLLRMQEGHGISFMPYFELILLVFIVVASLFTNFASWVSQPMTVAVIGVVMIVASYLHFVLVMIIRGWILSRRTK